MTLRSEAYAPLAIRRAGPEAVRAYCEPLVVLAERDEARARTERWMAANAEQGEVIARYHAARAAAEARVAELEAERDRYGRATDEAYDRRDAALARVRALEDAIREALKLNREMWSEDDDVDSPGEVQHAVLVHALGEGSS